METGSSTSEIPNTTTPIIQSPVQRLTFGGGGARSSTAKDYATFLQIYLNGGELNAMRTLSRTAIETVTTIQAATSEESSDYGLALGVMNEKAVSEGGLGIANAFRWGGYYDTQYFSGPKERVVGVIMKQTRDAGNDDTRWLFQQLVFQAIHG